MPPISGSSLALIDFYHRTSIQLRRALGSTRLGLNTDYIFSFQTVYIYNNSIEQLGVYKGPAFEANVRVTMSHTREGPRNYSGKSQAPHLLSLFFLLKHHNQSWDEDNERKSKKGVPVSRPFYRYHQEKLRGATLRWDDIFLVQSPPPFLFFSELLLLFIITLSRCCSAISNGTWLLSVSDL